jgi:hypothetical protein
MSVLYTHERNFGCRLHEFIYRGLKIIYIENEKIRVGVILDRGTDIFEFLYKPKDVDFIWRSFNGIKTSNFYPGSSLKGGNILDLPPCSVLNDEIDLSPETGRLAIGYKSEWPYTKGRTGEKIDLSRIPPVNINSYDRAYMYGLKEGWYGITNKELEAGFGLRWNKDIFKYIWFWQVYGGAKGYPFYSSTYNIAIEPNSSYPPGIENALKSKTNLTLKPKEKIEMSMAAAAFESKNGIEGMDDSGKVLLRNK